MTRKEIKLAAHYRGQWVLIFLTPIIFIAVMGAEENNLKNINVFQREIGPLFNFDHIATCARVSYNSIR